MGRPVVEVPDCLTSRKAMELVNWAINEGTQMGMGDFIARSAISVLGKDVFNEPSSTYFTVRFTAAGGGCLEMGGIRWGKYGALTTRETLSLENDGLSLGCPTDNPTIGTGEQSPKVGPVTTAKELLASQRDLLLGWALARVAAYGFAPFVNASLVNIHQTSLAREGEFARWNVEFRQSNGLIFSVGSLQLRDHGVLQWLEPWDKRAFRADIRFEDVALDTSWILEGRVC